jgi:hypothetical protein
MGTLAERARDFWSGVGVPIRPGASPEMLAAFEQQHLVRLPEDVRAFLRTVNGFEEREWDEDLFEWRCLDRWELLEESELEAPPGSAGRWFVITDWNLDGFLYAIRLTADPHDAGPIILSWGGVPSLKIADSFREFLEAYLQDPRSILR